MGTTESICVKNFIRFFQDNRPTFPKDNRSTYMTVRGKRYNYADLDSVVKLLDAEAVLKYGLNEWYLSPDIEKIEFFQNFVEGNYRQDLIQQREAKRKLHAKMKGNGKADLELPSEDYILEHLQPVRVLGDTRKESAFRFLDTKTQQMTDYDYWSVSYALKSAGFDAATINTYMDRILHIREDYDPKDTYTMRLIPESNNVYEVNLYIPPAWTRLKGDAEPSLNEDIEKLMGHLFPKPTCREFVYSWIYHSLTSRAGTYLYLCGGQGSGKNTLASLIAHLHGLHNTSNPKEGSFKGRFNYFLKNKRFVFFDEFNCRKREDKDILKSIINDRVQVEGKNKDHEDIRVHASYFLANNSLEAIGLDPIDRRFSVPDVTDDNIVPVYGRHWIQDLIEKFKDEDFIAEFGHWILHKFKDNPPDWENEEPYQHARFEEIVLATARMGLSEMITKILDRRQNYYEYYEEREAFTRVHKGIKYPAIQDWKKFLTEVNYSGDKLGKVEGTRFVPRPEFRIPEDEDRLD